MICEKFDLCVSERIADIVSTLLRGLPCSELHKGKGSATWEALLRRRARRLNFNIRFVALTSYKTRGRKHFNFNSLRGKIELIGQEPPEKVGEFRGKGMNLENNDRMTFEKEH